MSSLVTNVVSAVSKYPCLVLGGLATFGGMVGTSYFFPAAFKLSDLIREQCYNATCQTYSRSDRCISMMNEGSRNDFIAVGFLFGTAIIAGLTLYYGGTCTRKVDTKLTSVKHDGYGSNF